MIRNPCRCMTVCVCLMVACSTVGPVGASAPDERSVLRQFVEASCLDCHNATDRDAGLALDAILDEDIEQHAKEWEAVVRKLATRQMPPIGTVARPDEASYEAVLSWLTSRLDQAAERAPSPARTETLRRLTRTEYGHAVRDLLALPIDVTSLLPADESSQGFDNITVTGLSPTLLNRYVSAAEKISRLAVGSPARAVDSTTFRIRPDVTQDLHRVEGLPLGTRGGTRIPHYFPRDGEYEVQVWLMRDRNDELEGLNGSGLNGSHQLEILLDRQHQASFTIARPPRGQDDRSVDANLRARLAITAGAHDLAVTFVAGPSSLLESERQPLNVHYNFYRHPRLGPAVYQVSITGPLAAGQTGDTPSRRRIFACRPAGPDDEDDCARQILMTLLRRAYRRPVDHADLQAPLALFREGHAAGGFEAGIERALSAILVNPNFLFRIEREPGAGTSPVYPISDIELASRLSFFLWSSIPDDELLDVAERAELRRPDVLEQQVRRMLADRRSESLVTNFADQWLYLRNLESFVPDGRLFPDFDHNLRDAFRRETELLFEEIQREDRSVLALIDSAHTYLNERLARHYGIPHVYGSHFRRVETDEASRRGGLLRHGSILSVTSYATRTSPVIRGKWILENVLGTPPPPPPPNVPALQDNTVAAHLPVRERLAAHRNHAACAACHNFIDPVGFGLENFDAVGRWRERELERPVDASGGLPDGTRFEGAGGLEQALVRRPEILVRTLTEKLLTFALGRGVDYTDAPAIRAVLREAKADNFRFSSLILGIARSVPFQMRAAEAGAAQASGE